MGYDVNHQTKKDKIKSIRCLFNNKILFNNILFICYEFLWFLYFQYFYYIFNIFIILAFILFNTHHLFPGIAIPFSHVHF
jgi:hypothetical protein